MMNTFLVLVMGFLTGILIVVTMDILIPIISFFYREVVMRKQMAESYTLSCKVCRQVGFALQVEVNGEKHHIPLSQIKTLNRERGTVVMTAWIAKKKGFIS